MRYTLIHHESRKELGLSMNDYCVADMIYHLSNNPKSTVPYWCNMSKSSMADQIGITKAWVINSIQVLEEAGVVEKSLDGRLLRTTEKWYLAVIEGKTNGIESIPKSVYGVNQIGIESIPPSDNKRTREENKKVAYPFNSITFINKWDEWKQYRKEIKHPYKSVLSEQQALKELGKFSEEIAIRSLEIAMANSWRGFFPDKVTLEVKQTVGKFVA